MFSEDSMCPTPQNINDNMMCKSGKDIEQAIALFKTASNSQVDAKIIEGTVEPNGELP